MTDESAPAAPSDTPAQAEAAPEANSEATPEASSEAPEAAGDDYRAAFAKAMAGVEKADAAPEDEAPADETTQPDAPAASPDAKPPEKPEAFASRFAAIAEAEKKVRQRREELKPLEERVAAFERLQAEARANPLKALEALGHTYETLTQHVLSDGKPDPMAQMRAQLESIQAERQREKAEAAAAQQRHVVDGFKSQIAQTLKAKADTYEFASLRDAHAVDMAYQVLDAYAAQHGQLPGETVGDAINEALRHVEETLESEAVRYLTAKKLQAKLPSVGAVQPAQAPRPRADRATQQQQQLKPKTLTNSQASIAPPRVDADNLSRDELIARAARILDAGTESA